MKLLRSLFFPILILVALAPVVIADVTKWSHSYNANGHDLTNVANLSVTGTCTGCGGGSSGYPQSFWLADSLTNSGLAACSGVTCASDGFFTPDFATGWVDMSTASGGSSDPAGSLPGGIWQLATTSSVGSLAYRTLATTTNILTAPRWVEGSSDATKVKFGMECRMKISTTTTDGFELCGLIDEGTLSGTSADISMGVQGAIDATHFILRIVNATGGTNSTIVSTIALETTKFHVLRSWSTGDGVFHFKVDTETTQTVSPVNTSISASSYAAYIAATGTGIARTISYDHMAVIGSVPAGP